MDGQVKCFMDIFSIPYPPLQLIILRSQTTGGKKIRRGPFPVHKHYRKINQRNRILQLDLQACS